MSKIDQFESVFKAADKAVFEHLDVPINNVLMLTDGDDESHDEFKGRVQEFLSVLDGVTWHDAKGGDYSDVQALLDLVHKVSPELVCTYRNLRNNAWKWPYSLGDYLHVLTEETNIPILVLPHPKKEGQGWPKTPLNEVMAVTDHLTGDQRLVNYAVRFTPEGGTLFMTHIEDADEYNRFIELIGKIPELDTDVAREEILQRMLKEPRDFIESCQQTLTAEGRPITVKAIVEMGHFLNDYRKHITDNNVDLVVLNTKDDDQLAMHGLAYPLAVEFRDVPLLML